MPAAMVRIVRKDAGEDWKQYLQGLMPKQMNGQADRRMPAAVDLASEATMAITVTFAD